MHAARGNQTIIARLDSPVIQRSNIPLCLSQSVKAMFNRMAISKVGKTRNVSHIFDIGTNSDVINTLLAPGEERVKNEEDYGKGCLQHMASSSLLSR